ncbi:uncharacterized protein PFB0765w-like [Dendronephthya gigantea]|uniref:uncharacterized protein PFB0765w-like n=1 Tax=Dendronephthya gigantea TaxID=151771 RepID=UPI00106ADD85|nr:uncharacterized protein PFB0765w-like [Dendronephthya gigantea]
MEQIPGTVSENHVNDSGFLENAVKPKETESNVHHSNDIAEKMRNDSMVIQAKYDSEPNPVENHVNDSNGMIENDLSPQEQVENNSEDMGEGLKCNGVNSGEFLENVSTNGDVDINLENTLRESETIEAQGDVGGNENKDFERMQDDGKMSFEEILVLDASALTSQKIIEDALKKCAEVQSNGDIAREDENYDGTPSDGTPSDLQKIELAGCERPLSRKENEDIEIANVIVEDLKNGSSMLTEERDYKKLFESGEHLNNDFVEIQQQHEVEMQELRMTLQDEYQKQVLKISDELRDHYQNDMDEKIAKLEEDWELEFANQKREFDEQVSAVQREQSAQCQEAIERVTLDAEDQLKNMKYAYERETAEHKQRIKELLEREALWEMKENELANEKSEKENESLSKIKKLESQLSSEREEVESQLNGVQDEIKTLKKDHENEMANLTNELERKYSGVVDEMRKELKSKYQDEMDRKVNQVECHLREQYEQDLEKTKEEVLESTSTLKMKYEKQVSEIQVQLEELHERNQQHELREARLKENFESERKKVAVHLKEIDRKTQTIRALEQNKKDLSELEEKFNQCLNEKDILEKKMEKISESESKESIELTQDLARKNEIIDEMQRRIDDLHKIVEELQDVRNSKEYKGLEETIKTILQEKITLEQALEKELQKNELLTEEKRLDEVDRINDDGGNYDNNELEIKVSQLEIEKQSLTQQLEISVSEITSLQEKMKENEIIVNDLKSNCDAKILQITRSFEEEVNVLENELKMKKSCEEEAAELKKDVSNLNHEIAKLHSEIKQHKVTISELEETSQSRELEIANLIMNSPSPNNLNDQEFDFSQSSGDKTQQLEIELSKYKKKVEELEEEAEDKFETTLCLNCQDREKNEDILIQTKALIEKIKSDSQRKVQSLMKDLGNMEKAFQEQSRESEHLKEKLGKTEEDLRMERERILEISKLGKNLDVNENLLGSDGITQDATDTKGKLRENDEGEEVTLLSLQSQPKLEDDPSQLPSGKDFGILFDEQETFYKTEIARKDDEISKLIAENKKILHQVQNLKEKLNEGEAQYEQIRERTLEQKTKYENEINLMQNEIKMLIEENNRLKNIQETEDIQVKLEESEDALQMKLSEIQNLQAKLLETDNILTEKSSKFEQDMKTLNEILQDKENSISDYRTAVDLLQNSRKQLELDVSNQKQDFSEKETKLLHEIREIKVGFESEKTKILEDNFQEKEEMRLRIEKLEVLLDQRNVDVSEGDMDEFEGYEGVEQDNSLEEPMVTREYEGIGRNYFLEEHKIEDDVYAYHDDVPKMMTRNAVENLGDPKGYEGVNADRSSVQSTRNKVGQYEEIHYYPSDHLGHLEEEQSKQPYDKDLEYEQGLKTLWELKHEVLKEEYGGIDDKSASHESLFSDDKYKEIGSEESLELLKYEHEIDLLLERKENERLRDEIKTLTNCVDMFHDECECLKRSLDKTLHIVEILREERDELMKESDLNMIEHSELVLDLIKYEETISRLEKGNEKLEDDKKLLAECLKQKERIVSRGELLENETGISNSAKTKHSVNGDKSLERHTLFSDNPEVFLSEKRGSEVGDFQRKDARFLRASAGYQRNDNEAPRRGDHRWKRTNKLLEDSVENVELKSRRLVDLELGNEDLRKLSWPQTLEEVHYTQRHAEDDFNTEWKGQINDGHKIGFAGEQKMLHAEQTMSNYESQNEFGHRKQLHKEYYTASHQPKSKENRGVLGSSVSHRKMTPLDTSAKQLCLKTAKNTGRSSKTKNVSIMVPRRDESSYDYPKHSRSIKFAKTSIRSPKRTKKRYEYGTTDREKSIKSNSRIFSPKVENISRTPVLNTSTFNSSKFLNSSILTSTRENPATPRRLVPNLAGLSPIVSPLDRHHQSEKLRWQISEETQRTRDDRTTFLLNEDPSGLITRTPKREGTKSSKAHIRSYSADDRLLTSSREMTRDLNLEKPLVVNFEDFVFRHRVKSSEDVASIRDPSPAELWFS